MWPSLLLILIIKLAYLFYYFLTKNNDYWKKKNVPYIKALPLFGNFKDFILLKTCIGKVTKQLCEQFPEKPYIGVFYGTEPTLIVRDPDLLKLIMVKDFYYFHGREASKYADCETVTQVIFFTAGDQWKVIRQNLTPLFTSGKMKNMFPLIEKCTHDFDNMLEYEIGASNSVETSKLILRYTMDCVGSCAFGIDANLMQKDYEKSPFRNMSEIIFGRSDISGYKNTMRAIWPKLFYALKLQSFSPEVKIVMTELLTSVFKLRDYKSSNRNDFVDLILSLKDNDYLVGESIISMKTGESQRAEVRFDDEVMAGQCTAFFGGAFETSATALTLVLFELAKHPEAQKRVQEEVDQYLIKHSHKLEYDCVTELPYLTACFDETLRLHPVFSNIAREVMENYTLPSGLQLDAGIRIHIPVYSIHRDFRNFPDPEKFQPERFLPENIHKIKPFTYLPFGEGPRLCIGMRFAKMQVFAGLLTILKKYSISLADGMSSTVDYDPRLIFNRPICDVNLKFEHRNK